MPNVRNGSAGGLCQKLVAKNARRGEGKTYMLCVRKGGHKGKCRDFYDARLREYKKRAAKAIRRK